jgi:SPP1 gp7 family putative phage head morphogenesis protein
MAETPAPRPSEGNEQDRARTRRDKALVKAIIALLAAGAEGYGLVVGIRAALITWGLPIEVAAWLADLVSSQTEPPDLGYGTPGPMALAEETQARAWRAIYALGAAQRLSETEDLDRAEHVEEGYFARHLAAEERRQRAATLVDITNNLLGDRTEEQEGKVPLLGWRAVIDARTTPECSWANGQNFRADKMPVIGLPGSVHPRCRCTSGPSIPGAPLIPSL